MAQPDKQGPIVDAHVFIQMASVITGRNYSLSGAGEIIAKNDLSAMHARVSLQIPKTEIIKRVQSNDPIIQTNADEVREALANGDYASALQSANYLYGYGDMDNKDSLGGQAFQLSLAAHRLFMGTIFGRYATSDRYLSKHGGVIMSDARIAGESGDLAREHEILRGTLHKVALDGALGEDAKKFVDPFAMVSVE